MSETIRQTANKGTIAVIPGSWEAVPPPDAYPSGGGPLPSNWDPLGSELGQLGYSLLVVSSLPTQDPSATRSDYARAAADEIKACAQSPIKVIAGYSAGGLAALGTIKLLQAGGVETDDIGVALITASLPPLKPTDPRLAMIPDQRSKPTFVKAIRELADGRSIMTEENAKRLLFDRVQDQRLGRLALENLQPQYRPPGTYMPGHIDNDVIYVWDPDEQVREARWVRALAAAYGFKAVEVENAGHAVHLSQPKKLGEILVNFAERERDGEITVELPRQRQKYLYDEPPLAPKTSPLTQNV